MFVDAGLGAGGVGSFLFVFGEVEIGHVVLVVFGVSLATGEAVVVRTQNVGGQGYGAFQVGEAVTVWWRLTDARLLAA